MAKLAFGVAAISLEEADVSALARWLKRNHVGQFNGRKIVDQTMDQVDVLAWLSTWKLPA